MLDIDAAILPGKAAAGFEIGLSIDKVKADISSLIQWHPSCGASLGQFIDATSGWLSSVWESGREVLYFGKGQVELHFSAKGELYNIFVFDGYAGAVFGEIRVGDPLSLMLKHCPLEYDEADEMHYPAEDSLIKGIAFYAEELPLAEAPNQVISIISVHNWAKM